MLLESIRIGRDDFAKCGDGVNCYLNLVAFAFWSLPGRSGSGALFQLSPKCSVNKRLENISREEASHRVERERSHQSSVRNQALFLRPYSSYYRSSSYCTVCYYIADLQNATKGVIARCTPKLLKKPGPPLVQQLNVVAIRLRSREC